mgnify:FL=1|tara:strand:+ start:11122 stop:11844 length:723 start_codon:yes stop_codon:yes gene_type:complete
MTLERIGTCAIMQPSFLPWAGYFNLIANSEHFIFLTDAAFSKGSWHNRNQVLIGGEKAWITCPIERAGLNSALDSIQLQAGNRWREKMTKTLLHSYSKAPFSNELTFILDIINESADLSLVELNIQLIKQISLELSLQAEFSESRSLDIDLDRSKKLEALILNKNCTRYLSPVGAKDYLFEDGVLPSSTISLAFQEYTPESYTQLKSQEFVSHLSIFDIVANLGMREAGHYVLEGSQIGV